MRGEQATSHMAETVIRTLRPNLGLQTADTGAKEEFMANKGVGPPCAGFRSGQELRLESGLARAGKGATPKKRRVRLMALCEATAGKK